MSQNTEKQTTPAGEEAETVVMAEEISTRTSTRITRITRISNFRVQNSEGKIRSIEFRMLLLREDRTLRE